MRSDGIVLWGIPGDPPLDAIREALGRLGIRPLLIDQRCSGELGVELEVGRQLSGAVRTADACLELDAISAMFIRPHDGRWDVDDALLTLAELTPALVLNRPQAMAANCSKPFQSTQVKAVGLAVPQTLITTSPDVAREFLGEHGRVVYKSISGIRSIVGMLHETDTVRLADVVWCPTQFQRYVEGTDVRVHVVGDDLFACEVRCEAIDYRYAALSGHRIELSAYELPADCADRCFALARSTGLHLAGIDLRRSPYGEWYCFEVNPSPAFTFYAEQTGQPIDEAVALLLARGEARSTHRMSFARPEA